MPVASRTGQGYPFFCDIKKPDGSIYAHDTRGILKQVVNKCENMGYVCKVGPECEFYLFKPMKTDIRPLSLWIKEDIWICILLTEAVISAVKSALLSKKWGIKPESSHHEQGPGQNEVDFKFSDALSSADNLQSFKTVVKTIAARNGLYASFMPKPILDAPGSGMHVNISLVKNGMNVFKNIREGHSNIAESFIANILARTPEITLFLNPIANSYDRFGKFEAPAYVSWSHRNRSQLIRIPAAMERKGTNALT